MIDAMLNFVIALVPNKGLECFLGISTTVTNHYVAWLSIFLRAYRINKFFDIYE